MAKLTIRQIKAVKSVVVSYSAFYEHLDKARAIAKSEDKSKLARELNGLMVWARILQADQNSLGVELVMPEMLVAGQNGQLYLKEE